MSVVYLYHSEDSDFGGFLSAASLIPVLDQYCYMFGGERAAIHPADAEYPSWSETEYATLEEAYEAYPDHTWIYLDPHATKYLDEMDAHPLDDVVYLAGHDDYGYKDTTFIGERYKLRMAGNDFEGHAIPCLVAALCDRWSRSWQ